MSRRPGAVFFDLDGTLLDTAPDMVGALDQLRAEHGIPALDYEFARDHVSHGALGLLKIGFPDFDDERRDSLRERYLQLYADRLSTETTAFPGMEQVLDTLDEQRVPWGVVTNKPGWLTEPLLTALGLATRCACIVSGDTLEKRKPHPAPLLHAAALTKTDPATAVYVGDAKRDIEAGNAAGMTTVAALYGYVAAADAPAAWGADHTVEQPQELIGLFELARPNETTR
ncbi:MAG TPA: phosphoglycolate phosphatase [Chromatiales bacterium]|nr:phosphoglycolate phosphatase [Chromatiales bacterium]